MSSSSSIKKISKIVSEEFYQSLIQATQDGFWLADSHGKIVDVNQVFADMVGYSKDELTKMDIADIEAAESPEDVEKHIQKIMQQGSDHFESLHRKKDGSTIEVDISLIFLKPENLFVAFIRDVSEKKQLEGERKETEQLLLENEEKFRTIADFTYDWELWISSELELLYCSPSCERITGYYQGEFMRDPGLISRIIHQEDRYKYNVHVQHSHESSGREDLAELEFRIITRTGEIKWIGHACRPVFGKKGTFLGRRISNRDITDKKNNEFLLISSNKEINALNENILQMLKIMSHDIRSPLISIAAILKLLQRGSFGKIDGSVNNTVNDLSIRICHILGIADDCLGKAAAVDSVMKMEKKEIDLRQEVIDVILDELSGEVAAKNITIDNRLGAIPGGTIVVNASKMWLKVVYRNLLRNAIKYGPPGCIIAFGYEDHGTYYRLNVYNTGASIPEDKRNNLFTKFGRVRQEGEAQKEGVGMGLFLSKEVINQHGGEIWYEAKPEGNDFIFTLPKE